MLGATVIIPRSLVNMVALSGFGLYELGFHGVTKCVEIELSQLILFAFFSQGHCGFSLRSDCNLDIEHQKGHEQFDKVLMGLLRRILDTNKRVHEDACSAFATLEKRNL